MVFFDSQWNKVDCHSLVITNGAILDYHSKSIAMLKTISSVQLHATVIFWFLKDFNWNNYCQRHLFLSCHRNKLLIWHSFVLSWIEVACHSSVILSRTSLIQLHATVSFDFLAILIEATCQWYLFLCLNRSKLKPWNSLIITWIKIEWSYFGISLHINCYVEDHQFHPASCQCFFWFLRNFNWSYYCEWFLFQTLIKHE
jgi:hypothetical protein